MKVLKDKDISGLIQNNKSVLVISEDKDYEQEIDKDKELLKALDKIIEMLTKSDKERTDILLNKLSIIIAVIEKMQLKTDIVIPEKKPSNYRFTVHRNFNQKIDYIDAEVIK